MDKTERHNTRENQIISVFKAQKSLAWSFTRAVVFLTLLIFSLVVASYTFYNSTAASENLSDQTFGVIETTNIFPGNVSASRWNNLNEVLSQDLPDYALFQDFDADNSAFFGEENEGGETTEVAPEVTSKETPTEVGENPIEDPVIESDAEESLPLEPESNEQVDPVSLFWGGFNVFAKAELFPLAQLSITSSTEETVLEDVSDTGSIAEVPEVTEPALNVSDTESVDNSTGEEVSTDANASSTEATIEPVVEILLVQDQLTHDIKLTNFKTASLEAGQFVDSVQLRLSLAAQATADDSGVFPYIDVLFKASADDSFRSVGSILLDEEVSNAINGGYYLFALPAITDPELLSDVEVMLRINGSKEHISSIQLDAVWLELNARSVTPQDIEDRTDIENFTHLEPPKLTTLVSEELNFSVEEAPVFNLRYESQQNFLVRGFMKLFNKSGLEVKAISVNHEAVGHIAIDPDVTIAGDGLVTIELPGDELDVMRPGLYNINMLFEENGVEYVETFDFQWGMLTINPNKTSYEVGETAAISIGALSPNGNTLCEEDLALYITSPNQTVTKAFVEQSGKCNGNNVTDVPDYSAVFEVAEAGEYEMYLERLDETGKVLGFTTDTFLVEEDLVYSIERVGPTRIYPRASYPMNITVSAKDGFAGELVERVPASFVVGSTSASIKVDGEWQILTWDVSLAAGGSQTVSYGFDAPDISPYIYRVGEASLEKDVRVAVSVAATQTASSTEDIASSTITVATSSEPQLVEVQEESERHIVFAEHRQWQIASDAVGSLILMWDGPVIPSGWTCISCTGGDVFYQRFVMGSATAGTNGGAATHTHTASAAVAATTNLVTIGAGGAFNYASNGHTHTFAPTIGTANNLPSYRNLVIIQHNSAGEPTSIPAGAIAIFDAAVPAGWTQYSAQNGFYVRGESIANRTLTGGSNTHTHTITGTTGSGSGTANGAAGGTSVSNGPHTHTINSNTAAANSQPPYIEMIIGKLNSTSTMPNGVVGMWSEDAPTDWNVVSGSGGILENRFFKPSASYGTTGGSTTETPANVNGIVSSGPSGASNRGGTGTTRPSGAHTHLVNVTGFSTANIVPPYRTVVFAKRAGGQPPAAPVIHELFDQEKTGTSTPEFEFTTDDSVGTDSLVYQFQWDTDSDLDTARIGDRSSDNETGCSPDCFENTVSGGDTSPFNEGERIRFTIQDPLTSGTTYYYRVRAKKSAGTTWGTWSNVNTFTYVADTDPSQWLQTVDAQFNTGVFAGTETFGSDSVQIADAQLDEVLVAYGEGTVTTPRYRIWDGTAWSTEASALSVGGTVEWVKTAAAPTRDEYVLGVQDASNDVNVQVFNGVTDTWSNLVEVTASIADRTRRGFDVAYETTSGDALVVYCNGTDAAYRVWNGSSWSAQTSITTASTNTCNYIMLASDPTSDEIIMVTRDNSAGSTDYEALVWNGSSWGNSITGGSIVDTNNEGMAVEYEESGGQAIVAVANGTNASFIWTTWNGTEWSTAVTHALGNDLQWATLKADSGSDNMALCYMDTDNDIGVVRWDGEAWAVRQELNTAGNADTGRAVSCEFETTAGRDGYIMVPYSDTAAARYRFWNGTTFPGQVTLTTIQDSWEVGSVRAGDGKILGFFHDDVNTQYDFSYWDGTAWSSRETLEGTPSVTAAPFKSPIDMSAKVYQFIQGTYTTDPVDFGLVPNRPTWGEVLWSATEPIGTSVEVQVLYATTSACNVLVPDGVLPGNSTGFTAADAPINLSGLSTSTYSSLCLRATLTSQSQSMPTLDDWTISWERQPFLAQSQYRWYVNRNSEDPNDVWPAGVIDLLQNEAIPQEYSPGSGDVLRLRMALRSDNAPFAADSQAFKLQYSQTSGVCASSTTWYDVGEVGSTTASWRGYNNLLAFDGSTISTLLLGTDVGGTYEEENNSDDNPNTVAIGDEAEWDWVLEHNGALDGAQYCFRMVTDSGVELSSYEEIPSLVTNASPLPPILEKVFDNEQVASTSPWFEFSTTDPEDEDVSYQIQVDDSYDFSSTVLDRNSTTHLAEFENMVTPADKDAFIMGQTIRFKPSSSLSNNTTYYWRVRAKDGQGSNDWGEWSNTNSFTVTTGTAVTSWFQTTAEQFNTNENENTETTVSNDVILTTGFTVGTTTSTAIDFDSKTTGNAWGTLTWNNNLSAGAISYAVEYLNGDTWELVPDGFLSGNSAGFSSSPVSLLGLDPLIHNEIRVRAVLTDVGGTPRLLDWKVEWGFAVEQPTQISLFDNEKVGTTTPTFTFTTSDPDNDDIQYELSYSTDKTFTSSTTVRSGVAAGFANQTVGIDTSPFFSGDTIGYQVQSALTDGETYWWRVRGRDPSGGNAWSVWSSARSFTVDTSVSVSTWFQTTDEQFETDNLTNTQITGTGGVEVATIIREVMFAYAEGTIQSPRYRLWNGSSWSDEASGVSVGGAIGFVETAATQVRNEYILATQETTGRVRAQIYDGNSEVFDDLETIVASVPSSVRRGFDVAYESSSGDALVVACNGTEATYSVWNGSSWSSAAAITLAVTGNCNWIELASDPTSDEIIMVVRNDTVGVTDFEALVWNGSSWGNSMTMGSVSEVNNQGTVVEYEESGDRAVVAVSNGSSASFAWNSWNGSAWTGATTQALQDDFENGRLRRDVGSDDMALCSIDQDGQLALVRWTGSTNSWNAYQTIDLTGNSKNGHPSDCVFETTSGRDGNIMIPYSDTLNGRYQFWNGTTLSGEASISTIQDSQEVLGVRAGDGNILAFFYDDVNTQYDFSYWDGLTWSIIETLEPTVTNTNPRSIPFSAVARQFPTFTEGTVVSSPIDFDEGSGLKWQSVAFTDTTPGSSEILYQIEYLNGDTWELIPDGALAGNSTGFASSPIDISDVSRITYNTIRLKANLACISGSCPTLNDWTVTWSSGINVAGTLNQYDRVASTTSGTIAVAVNGVVQGGKTATVSGGVWSIPNVTAFAGDIVTTFVTGAADAAEAVGVTLYDGDGDITGITLFERYLSLGSNDATTTPLTNIDIGLFDFTNSEDVFFNVNGTTLSLCVDAGCADARLFVRTGTVFAPTGRMVVHDFVNNGTFTAGSFTHEVNGSWDNNGIVTMTGSTVVFAATSSSEVIDSTGAPSATFNNVTLGTTTGSGTWSLGSSLDVDGGLTVSRGTFARGSTAITVAGNVDIGTNGFITGVGTTTFDGSTAATWRNQNAVLQNTGRVVIDGTSKAVTLTGNVAAESMTIGANDTLDASASNYDITVYTDWNNQNNFVARGGEVFFAATTTGRTITTAGDAFFDVTFSGSGGGWSFTETTALINNDIRVSAGTVTLPSATTTIAGSFLTTSGTFQHNNGTLYFTSGSAETVTFAGSAFTNVAHNLWFQGAGNWTITDTNATSTNDVVVQQGTLNFPSGVMAIGGTLRDIGGVYAGGTGTVRFYSGAAEVLTAGGSSFNNVTFDGAGSWSFTDTNVSVSNDLIVQQGTLTLPSIALLIAGSYDNNAVVVPGTGTVQFNSTDTGETIDFGASSLHNIVFNNANGGWTVTSNGTTTNNFTITNATSLTINSGVILSVGNTFTNSVGGAATTWAGSTLALRAGNYSLNTKVSTGDVYGVLEVDGGVRIAMWNSSADSYSVDSLGSLYSQDHNAVDGALYIFGEYTRTSGTEHWSYATDFDGTALGGSSRQVDVRFASGATAAFTGATLNVTGISTASTTIANQGIGTYTIDVTGGTVTAQYYEFSHLGSTGLSLLGGVSVPQLNNGSFAPAVATGAGLTLSSTTIDANPSKQILGVRFATTSTISAFNVAQTDGTPTSFWWFRDGTGNLYGEAFDNDTGNPGSVRFNDSSLVFTISGTVYSDDGTTPLTGGTCDGSTQVVRVVVNGGTSYTGSCSNIDGSYSIPGVAVTGDPTITMYLDNAPGGQRGSVITRTPTADIADAHIYVNRVIVRNEDIDPLTIDNLAVYDVDNDTDLRFAANGGALTVQAGNELFVWNGSTFTPGGVVTLYGNAGANSYDGTLYLGDGSTFNTYASTTLTVGGRFVVDPGATFNAASSTVLLNATTSGKSISASGSLTFNNLTFNGSGGTWNITPDIVVNGDMAIDAGTVTGTGDISLPYGSLTGNGTLSLGAGTTTLARSNTLGGTSAWTFYNLELGNGVVVGTTTPVSVATTTVAGRLTISAAHFLDAGATTWDLSGTGTVFVENGTFLEDTSTIRYSGNGANVRSTPYYNLDINAGAGSPTYTATGLGINVINNLTIGGVANSTFNLNSSDPALDVNGSVVIRSNGTFVASNSALLTIAQNFTNDGVFTSSGGRITFDGAPNSNISAGNSSFSDVFINKTGAITFIDHATSTGIFRIQAASAFTLSSGQQLAVGGTFFNGVGGAATTWTGSTLHLYNGGNYSINAATTTDSYATISVDGTTQIRMWNSDAASYAVDGGASLYSQDHAAVDGDLYIFGNYRKTTGSDFWSYTRDFDGAALGGSSRKVDVFIASGSSASFTGGSLEVLGVNTASTTIQNQGSGSYGLLIGGAASTSLQFYEVTDINSSGLVLTGAPTINNLSNGNLEVSQNGGSAITIGGTVITANPAKNFNQNRFALQGVGSGFNVTATGTSISAWRFANHYGDIDGESFDVDPAGDPGYVSWDDSVALITVSGNIYSDESSTVSAVCDGVTNNISLRVAGITTYTTSCDPTTGAYSIASVSYGSADTLVVYIDGETPKGAAVTQDPITNVTNFNIYENRVVVRHEGTAPLTIDDMSVWDSSDDVDIPFTALNSTPDTLTLPANTKLLVASGKTFQPGGNVIISGGGAGAAYDGTLELYSNANWIATGAESLSVGGSMILGAGADYTAGTGTTTFTTTGTARTIDLNAGPLHNVAFTGSGSWTITDTTFTANGNVLLIAGTLDLPTGTSTFNGSFVNSGGIFDANSGVADFSGAATHTLRTGGSSLATTIFTGGNYVMTDVNATSTGSVTIESGTVTLPSGYYAIGGDFLNEGGAITHNTSELVLGNATAATLLASSSDLFAVRFAGGGAYTMLDKDITLLGSLFVSNGSLTLASGTIAIGGSFDATGGTFTHSSSTILFNSSDTGEVINPGVSDFFAVQIGAPTGGYTLTGSATTTHNFTLASAASFAVQSGVTLRVEGVFTNSVGGTNTNWNSSTLVLAGANAFSINNKTTGADQYNTLIIDTDSDIRMWNSAATTTTVLAGASLYSQDHATVNGYAYIYGDFHISSSTEYWSYATDFDGTNLSGSERAVNVRHAANATTTIDGGTLNIVGTVGNETNVTNQGSGTYAFVISGGTFNAQRYAFKNLNVDGLTFTGSPAIGSLAYGDFELAVSGGSLITVSSSTIDANASFVIPGTIFATTTAITGNNVSVLGGTTNAWTFISHSGNLDGEAYDDDGLDACGSIRWSDSACLITQQTHYRWRNDDGGVGAQASEWYNTAWDARKSVRVDNVDATTYTDAAVQLLVEYDSDMQADFDDLRFTAEDGVTPLSYWIGSTTNSVAAEVWVKIPTLGGDSTANVFMYYNNPTATSSESIEDTFFAADDFEDGNISEYSGQTSLFGAGTSFPFDGVYGLDNAGDEAQRANTGGIYRLDQVVSQGQTFRFMQYVDTVDGSGDEVCTKFGVQSPGSSNDNYAVCLEQFGTDRLSLVRDAVDNDASGTILASSTVTYATGWYEIEVDWETDGDIIVSLSEADGTLVATISDNDTTYSSGGIGFTYWFHFGGWDSVTSRPTLTTEPLIRFGAEQTDGGATWKAELDAAASYDAGDIARLRVAIENSGLAITGQQLLLEYAALGAAPSCEAVDGDDFVTVPVQASCGSSPVCMQSSTYITNGSSIADLLLGTEGTYTLGQVREDPSNSTTAIDIDQNHYTEVEYAITPTINAIDENLCFRVTNNGSPFDTYLKVAQLSFQFDPTVTNAVLNEGLDINLIPGTTTSVYATGTATDLNGAADLVYATGTIYRIGASGGAACTPNNNDCYVSACSFTNCSGNTCDVECRADIFFHADPTDAGSLYDGQEWLAVVEVEDLASGYAFDDSIGVALNSLRAIDVKNTISYGSLAVNTDTGASNASTSIENLGNTEIDVEVEGTDMTDGTGSTIPAYEQKFATSTFTYSGCTSCYALSSTTPFELDIELFKPTVSTPIISDEVYWGVRVPFGINSTPHSGMNVFTPVSP